MTPAPKIRELMLPWAGMLGAAIGWSLAHQIGSDSYFDHCSNMTPLIALLIGFLGLACAVTGGLLSWSVARQSREGTGARHFIAMVSSLFAALFSVALIWQTASSLIIPRCFG